MSRTSHEKFRATIMDYFAKSGRHDLPWRLTDDPYKILVSEVMLQQTQVSRVLIKYKEFLKAFPTVQALAKAPTADVLRIWQGLGYNRRALLLKRTAETVVRDFGGKFPRTADELESLPGIGQSTRGALMAFAFGIPTTFIETNVRAVYIHFFFASTRAKKLIHDRDILSLIAETVDRKNPRTWYYALMDYGVHLKQTLPNPSRKSAHHAKQSAFKGSNREVRARILKFILAADAKGVTEKEIVAHIGKTRHNVSKNIAALTREGFIHKVRGQFTTTE